MLNREKKETPRLPASSKGESLDQTRATTRTRGGGAMFVPLEPNNFDSLCV
jgi:hypothetical protein